MSEYSLVVYFSEKPTIEYFGQALQVIWKSRADGNSQGFVGGSRTYWELKKV